MKSIFNKLMGFSDGGRRGLDAELPTPLSTENIHDNQRRALVGWIANRMGQKLQMDNKQAGALIYLSFTSDSVTNNPNDEQQYLLYLSSCLVEWLTGDVYLSLKEMRLPDKFHVCLLEIYEEIKQDIGRYIPEGRSPEISHVTEDDEIWQVYRDVIFAATQRKFLLIRKTEVDEYKQGSLLCRVSITERSDIPKARDLAKQNLLELGFSQSVVMSQILVISEAITNILKHAKEGIMFIVATDTEIHVLVEDKGSGFPLKLLPNTTLMAGYSTKKSLGQGFTLMMKMTDQVLLSTVPDEGSTLILVFNRKGGEQNAEKQSVG